VCRYGVWSESRKPTLARLALCSSAAAQARVASRRARGVLPVRVMVVLVLGCGFFCARAVAWLFLFEDFD